MDELELRPPADLASVVHRDGRILHANPAATALLGLGDPELRGRPLAEILADPSDMGHGSAPFDVRTPEGTTVSALTLPCTIDGEDARTTLLWPARGSQPRALHDPETGLAASSLFEDRVAHFLDRAAFRARLRCGVLCVSLPLASSVVPAVQRIASSLRPSDTLARLGEHELGVLVEDVADASQAVRTARRVLEALRRADPASEDPGIRNAGGASIGIVVGGEGERSATTLLEQARGAVERAREREAGWAIHDESVHVEALSRAELERALRRAVDQWELELHYQPIFGLATGRVVGFEALLRWNHPERDLVLPGEFLPLAEEIDVMRELGDRVLREACEQVAAWSDGRGAGPFVTVNLSRRQLEAEELPARLAAALRESGIRADRLCFEVGEAVLLEEPDAGLAVLRRIRDLGARVSLDDFGLGHASLSLLHRFPFDEVKIDRWLVERMGRPHGTDRLVEGILGLCRSRRILPVAEGVERLDQEERLRELGCVRAQGFLYSKPLPASLATDLLAGDA